jgi:hypothetical protein
VNVLSANNGGKIVVTSSPENSLWTDGDEKTWFRNNHDAGWIVFGFNDGAKIKTNDFRVLIPQTDGYNARKIVLSYSNDSPTGNFTVIDTIKPMNALITETPFQKFNFPAVKAKYIKVELIGYLTYIYELQLMGTYE